MRFPRAAAWAAAALMAAGCDYWRNLTEDKAVTRVPLTVEVHDAWTGEVLREFQCRDSARGLALETEEERITLQEAGTGFYALACSSRWYYTGEKRFQVGGNGAAVVVELARRGGDEWYSGEFEKAVSFALPKGSEQLYFPGNLKLKAFPADSNGKFRYIWKFSGNPQLDLRTLGTRAAKDTLDVQLDDHVIRPGLDTLTLTVMSRLAGRDEYEVGSHTAVVAWVRNKMPILTAYTNKPLIFLSCEDVTLITKAIDPDGNCDSVLISSAQVPSPIGRETYMRSCEENRGKIATVDPYGANPDSAIIKDYKLLVKARDQNGETVQTEVEFQGVSNRLPRLSLALEGNHTAFMKESDLGVKVHFVARDERGTFSRLLVDWGDSTQDTPDTLFLDTVVSWTLRHSYAESGRYRITATAVDNCLAKVTAATDSIRVIQNTAPKVAVADRFRQELRGSLAYGFDLSVQDPNISDSYLDSITYIRVDWGDGQDSTENGPSKPHLSKQGLWQHVYAAPLDPSGYTITIEVRDAYQGPGSKTFTLLPKP